MITNKGKKDMEEQVSSACCDKEFAPEATQVIDNWQHKTEGMLCGTCMFYVPKRQITIGRCRRNAPTLGGWPVVFSNDWCGNHKLES